MSKILNLAKGRTYSCTTSTDTTVTMSDGGQVYTVNIYAPQGIFVAVAETAVIANDSAVVRQLFYSASASGIGVKPVKMQTGDTVDPDNTENAVSGSQVAKYIDDHTMMSMVVWESTTPPTVDQAKFNTIYLVPVNNPVYPTKDTYDEWMKVKKADSTVVMERIGSTALRIDSNVTQLSNNAVSSSAVYNFTNTSPVFLRNTVNPQSGYALQFLKPNTKQSGGVDGLSVAYSYYHYPEEDDPTHTTPLTKWFNIKPSEDGTQTLIGSGTKNEESVSVALEDIKYAVSNAYVQESATSIESGGSASYIDERVRNVLSSRTTSRLTEEQTTQALAGNYYLHEDDIIQLNMTGTQLDISKLSCLQDATAEIWIDVYTSSTIKIDAGWTWLELSAPSSLNAGYRYVFTIRNDGPIPMAGSTDPSTATTKTTHHIINLAYQEAFPTA